MGTMPEYTEEDALAADSLALSASRRGETYWIGVWELQAQQIREEVRLRVYEQLKGMYG